MNKIFFHITSPPIMSTDTIYDSVLNIDNYSDNTINHIMIGDLLDYYDSEYIDNIIDLIAKKITKQGYLEIQAPDISELCIASASAQIDTNTVKQVLKNRKTIHTIYDIEKILQKLSFTIYKKRYVNIFEYYILATK